MKGENLMKLEEKITLHRKKNGLSQEVLAEKIGVSRQAVSKWETGDALPEVTKLKALAETFNVTVDFLLDESQAEYLPPTREHRRSLMDKYLDGVESFSDKAFAKLGILFKKYGWVCGIFLIILGAYRVLTCIFSVSTIAKIGSVGAAMGIPMGAGFAIAVTIFQILIGIAFIVGGIVVMKKLKPKKDGKSE